MVAAQDERKPAGNNSSRGNTGNSDNSSSSSSSRLLPNTASPEREGMTTTAGKKVGNQPPELDMTASFSSSSSSSSTTSSEAVPSTPSFSLLFPDLPPGGQHQIRGNHDYPVPLGKARDLLINAVRDMPMPSTSPSLSSTTASPEGPSPAPSSSGFTPRFLRFEVPVSDILDEESALLWLRGQPERLMPRIFFRVPERNLIMAGVGSAHVVKGGQELGVAYKQELGLLSPGVPDAITYYGGGRFDPHYPKPSVDWQGFGAAYLVLPALELIRDIRSGDEGGEGGVGGFRLAVNVRYSSLEELQAGKTALLHLLRDVHVKTTDGDDQGDGDALLPAPVSCEEPSQFDAWHEGIGKALLAMKDGKYRKVVLARAAHFTFPQKPCPLDLVLRLRGHYGYLFCLQLDADRAFLGCTPEQLFRISGGTISTEALAGTRPRGVTPEEDERLANELMASQKDRFENRVTAESIEEALSPLVEGGREGVKRFPAFVLRLQHVQHICHKISARLLKRRRRRRKNKEEDGVEEGEESTSSAFDLLAALHPTPAVAGEPRLTALQAIRQLEPFDRGFYAGPVGFLSPACAEFAVAIRSVLIVRERAHVFAGAGIVPGSTAEGEWAEIGAKMANFVRMFPRPSQPLRSLPNLATLWATLVIEELVRNGITHFVIAPGSRSTPLVTAAARHPHTTLMVHHDERGAGFYCVGYARARGRPAAVIVTSGTAVANLLPAAVEAATDRVPLLLLTADRPPEQRDCGANQTVAQPNMFLHFARWSKDVPCPTHEVLASSLLSDIDYAVSMARGVDPGPVHLNFMLRENLAPEGGAVRDTAVPGLHSEWPDACLGDRRFAQWERSLQPYTSFPRLRPSCPLSPELLAAVHGAERGLLVLGRLPQRRDRAHVRWLAQELRWPVFADVGSGLRCDPTLGHLLIGPYESLLADPLTCAALDADVILQIGAPLVSKRLPKFMVASRAATLIHVVPSPARRDPELSATHHVCSDIPTFVRGLDSSVDWQQRVGGKEGRRVGGMRGQSGLLPLLKTLAVRIENEICDELGPDIACAATPSTVPSPFSHSPPSSSSSAINPPPPPSSLPSSTSTDIRLLNEPMVAHLVARLLPAGHGLFLSNSMPVRDVEVFATCSSSSSPPSIPPSSSSTGAETAGAAPLASVAMNRGASGIDGILSTAMGYATGLGKPVTLLVGDMACLHDLNALHALSAAPSSASSPAMPLTVVLVNNGGGGIFSFLPIARHADVFSPFFDSPHDLQFGPVTQAFNLPYHHCKSARDLTTALTLAQASGRPSLIEVLTDRAQNVRIHRQLGAGIRSSLHAGLTELLRLDWIRAGPRVKPSLLLLHGFLGCKEDWAPLLWTGGGVGASSSACSSSNSSSGGGGGIGMSGSGSSGVCAGMREGGREDGLALDYDCVAVDLPGHGSSAVETAGAASSVVYSLPVTALAVIQLLDRLGIEKCAVMGYSMGGRLAMYLAQQYPTRVSALIVVSAHPGLKTEGERLDRREDDRRLGERLGQAAREGGEAWDAFLRWWYSKTLWGRLAEKSPGYGRMMQRRRGALARSEDPGGLVRSLLGMSVAQQPSMWEWVRAGTLPTLVVYGMNDSKYSGLADELRGGLMGEGGREGGREGLGGGSMGRVVEVKGINDSGHAVLVEKEGEMLRETTAFLRRHFEDPQGGGRGKGTGPGGGGGGGKTKGGASVSVVSLAVASSSSSLLQQQQVLRVASLRWKAFALPLKKPLVLSSGPPLTHRQGLLLALEADSGVIGVGEVSPLPGFSQESLSQAEQQLKALASSLRGRALPKVGGSRGLAAWMEWLQQQQQQQQHQQQKQQEQQQQQQQQQEEEGGNDREGDWLLPSVRAGMEMALVHVLAQEYRVGLPAVLTAGNPSHLLHTGQVFMNGLVLRSSSSSSSGSGSRKVKVGGRPVSEDIARVDTMTAALASGHRLRLDANQSWSLEEATAFIRGLAQPERVEYLEEPCQDPLIIPELYHLTEQRIKFALDETLASPPHPLSELVGMAGLMALVLKPTVLGGLNVCLDLHALGSAKGLLSVVSSSFESSVGLAHLTVLASVLNSGAGTSRQNKTGGVHTLHGLSTYDVFAREEGEGDEQGREGGRDGYGRLVMYGSRSMLVDVLGCGEFLDGCIKKMKHDGRWRDGRTSVGKEEETAAPERAGRETSNGKRNDPP